MTRETPVSTADVCARGSSSWRVRGVSSVEGAPKVYGRGKEVKEIYARQAVNARGRAVVCTHMRERPGEGDARAHGWTGE